jgi:hypothetical protein
MSRFIEKEDCFLDNQTGFKWSKENFGPIQYENITYNIIPIGWKIPSIKELFTLTDHNLFRPATSLPGMKSTGYWSTSLQVCTTDDIWIVNFSYGGVLSYRTRYNCYIRYIKVKNL